MAAIPSERKRFAHVPGGLLPIMLILGHARPPWPWTGRTMLGLIRILAMVAVVAMGYPARPIGAAGATSASFAVRAGQAAKLSYAGARLDIGAGAVTKQTTITIASLSGNDLAKLETGMTDTTLGPQKGYRFLPHNYRFAARVQVSLPYDKALIPAGFSEQDLYSYFFDEELGQWSLLERVKVDTQAMVVVSATDHFTDMINAVVVAPDHPETQAFNPNSIAGVKAADPGAAIALIAPPQPSYSGDAQLTYPIELPPGRAGMQPHLTLSYRSDGGNGWLGVGWDLATPAVTIDTRWGVPRYDPGLETETYTLNGQQLTPLAHRGAPVARSAEKIFHSRVETQFSRIERHGTSPSSYWWESTDKNGVRAFFGGTPESGPDPSATLRTDAGAIFRWALVQTRDPNGNAVRYAYDLVADVGIAGGTVPGRQLYLRRIDYTRSNASPGPYAVLFQRDSELPGFSRRPDVQIDARGGFKQVTAALLKRIAVTFNGDPVRSYDLAYQEGAFQRTLLQSITPRGTDGSALPPHVFGYFDDLRSAPTVYQGFDRSTTWNTGQDHVDWTTSTGRVADRLVGPLAGLLDFGGASALSGAVSDSVGGHLYVGFNPAAGTKTGSGGAKVGFGFSDSDTLLLLLDLNGDGLPDKVYRRNQDGAVYLRLNQSGPTSTTTFGPPIPLPTLPVLSQESSMTWSFGAEEYFVGNAMVNHAETFSNASVYFSDVNGDGLPDLIQNGTVLFNRLANGIPTFGASSADTPVPIDARTVDATGLVEDLTAVREQAIDNFPLVDTLRRWEAPFAGTVAISGPFQLVKDSSPGRASYKADGVRVAIQKNEAELFSTTIAADDYGAKTPTGVSSVAVSRGDRIYFRVGSVFDGKYDQVAWDPIVQYTGVAARSDVNSLDVYKYQASEDFTLAGRRAISVQAPFAGTLQLAGALHKSGATTDDVTVQLLKNDVVVFSDTRAASFTGDFGRPADLLVAKDDTVRLRVKVDSPIDVGMLRWDPRLLYTAISDPAGLPVQDSQGNYLVQLDPPYDIDLYPGSNLTAPQDAYVATQSGTLTVETVLTATGPQANGNVTFTVKKPGALLAKRTIPVVNGVVGNTTVSIAAAAGDALYFDYSAYDPDLGGQLINKTVLASYGTPGTDPTFVVPSAFHSGSRAGIFPQPYRGWAVAGYNGNRARATEPIHESDLPAYFDKQTKYDPRTAKAYLFYPVPSRDVWRGPDDLTLVGAGLMSSSRLGADTIAVPTSESLAGAEAVGRLSRTSQDAAGGGLSFLSGSVSSGSSKSQLDYLDMNGDAFPDVVGNGRVQYTTPSGGLEAHNRAIAGLGAPRSGDNGATNLGVGGSPAHFRAGGDGRTDASEASTPREQRTGSQMVTLGLSGNLGFGDSSEQVDLVDVNGDGLPDRVAKNGRGGASCGASLCVALNLGYGFADFEPWGDVPLGDGASRNFSLSASGIVGFNAGLYDFAGGLSLDKNSSHGGCRSVELIGVGGECDDRAPVLLDLSGDGLPDRVRVGDGGTLLVRFNTGNGFGPEVGWTGALSDGVARSGNGGLGGGVYFTIGIPACLVACWVIVNPGADVSRHLARTETVIRDVDGDGRPDHLASASDGSLTVARNRTDRTNLLATVRRPLGATISLDYERAGNTTELLHSRWVLAHLTIEDGHPGDGVDRQLTTFRYENGRYDQLERDFLGFARVVEEQRDTASGGALYRVVEHEFRTDSVYTKGLSVRQMTRNAAGLPFVETERTYVLRDVLAGTEPVDGRSLTATIFPQLVRTDNRFHEGMPTPSKSTYSTQQYDAVGNVAQFFDAGDVGAQDDVRAVLDYADCPATYIVGKPNKVVVTDSAGALLRRREATIDCVTGSMTQLRQYLSATEAATADLEYFPNGNLRQFTGPPNGAGQRFALTYDYDPAVQTHLARTTDSFGYVSATTHDARLGVPLTHTDLNNNQLTYGYDAFGRVSSVIGPYEQGGTIPTISFAYHPEAAVPWAISRHFDRFRDSTGADTIDSAIFVDGLSRVVQSKRDATLHTGPDTPARDAMIVSGKPVFDAFGRVVEERYPVTEPAGTPGVFNPGVDPVTPTRSEYDVLDRQTKLTLPDNATTTTAYGFGPDRAGATRFEVTVTDAKGIPVRSYRDVRSLVTSIKRFNQAGAQTIWTSYRYDPLEQLTELRDDKDNRTTLTYDALGRRTAIDSPDGGRTETVYDLASNAIGRVTANLRATGKQVSFSYDFDRLTRVTYPDFPANNVTYTYGGPGATQNRAGRIVRVTDQAGSEERFYGKLGETTGETRTIVGFTGAGPYTYTTAYVYDTFGRLQRLTYPDGEVLTYRYDAGGDLRQATGQKGGVSYSYLSRLEYDELGQRAFVESGNGVRSQYSYSPQTRRLETIRSGKPGSGPFQDLHYSYDPVGNVTALANQVPVPAPSQFGGPTSQTFTYDDLYRLVSSDGSYQFAPGKSNRYSLRQSYNTIDNVLTKTQTHDIVQSSSVAIPQHRTTYTFAYDYTGSHPHAATHIDARTFSYDANGNQTGWTNDLNGTRRTVVWDEENRVQSIFDNGHEKSYKYDDKGERVVKRGPQGETTYVNQYFTVRNGTIGTKHVYAGTARLASKLMKQSAEEKDQYFYHPDHLGSSNYVTDASGALHEHLEYFPFGETWVQEATNTQRTPYLFTGKELDEETGLYYHGARYYDPRISTFISTDPLLFERPEKAASLPAFLNPFGYVLNNPLRFTDPTGREEAESDASKDPRERIAKLADSGTASNRQKALDQMVDMYFTRPAQLEKIVYDPNHAGAPETGGQFGKKQTITIGPSFFDHIRKRWTMRVLTLGHELQHVDQRAGKNPIKDQNTREFLAHYWESTATVGGLPRKVIATTSALELAAKFYGQMPQDAKNKYRAQFETVQRGLRQLKAIENPERRNVPEPWPPKP
jgi:RHS repeat-associated protein